MPVKTKPKSPGFELSKSYLIQKNGTVGIPAEAMSQLNWSAGKTRVRVEIDYVQGDLILREAK